MNKEFKRLSDERLKIEAEIQFIVEELSTGEKAPGLKGNLVDEEGFPRSDLDLWHIRELRHRLAILQTDHMNIMKIIEEEMEKIYIEAKKTSSSANHAMEPQERKITKDPSMQPTDAEAFAKIMDINDDSPAFHAGLRQGDLIVSFGTVNITNNRKLKAIQDVVMLNIGKIIKLNILRQTNQQITENKILSIQPKKWNGPGYLGCHIVPVSPAP